MQILLYTCTSTDVYTSCIWPRGREHMMSIKCNWTTQRSSVFTISVILHHLHDIFLCAPFNTECKLVFFSFFDHLFEVSYQLLIPIPSPQWWTFHGTKMFHVSHFTFFNDDHYSVRTLTLDHNSNSMLSNLHNVQLPLSLWFHFDLLQIHFPIIAHMFYVYARTFFIFHLSHLNFVLEVITVIGVSLSLLPSSSKCKWVGCQSCPYYDILINFDETGR